MAWFRKSWRTVLLLTGWVILVGIGFVAAASYETSAGARATTPERWPEQSRVQHATGRPTIVMFAHPRCPCTRASLTELATIMNDERHDALAVVAFMKPESADDDWSQTGTWETAGSLPRTQRMIDADGTEAVRFGVKTSGHVVVYDADGKLLFSGGITGSRGHLGDNLGRQGVIAQLVGAAGEHDHAVFGCPLRGE